MAETLNISDIRLYNLLKNKFGEKEAKQFVALIKEEVNGYLETKKDFFASKDDINKLELKLAQIETQIAKTEKPFNPVGICFLGYTIRCHSRISKNFY